MLGAGGGAGCGPPVQVSSTTFIENAPPIESLLMIADIKSPVFADAMYDGFQKGMMTALSLCHVEGRLVHEDSLGLDEEERLLRVLKEFQPGAQMLIDSLGGTLQGNTPSERLFDVKLFMGASKEVAWRAKVVMQDTYDDPGVNGVDLAVHIISRLRADGLLKSCPSGELSSAVCRKYPRAAPICR
jgi:hypothetical protein